MEQKFFVVRHDVKLGTLIVDKIFDNKKDADAYVERETKGMLDCFGAEFTDDFIVVPCKNAKCVLVKWDDEQECLFNRGEFDYVSDASKVIEEVAKEYSDVDDYGYDESGEYIIYAECVDEVDSWTTYHDIFIVVNAE